MGLLPPEPWVVVTVTPRWSPCACSTAWSLWGLQDDGTALLPTALLVCWGGSHRGFCMETLERQDSITAQLKRAPSTCSAADNIALITGGSAPKEAAERWL